MSGRKSFSESQERELRQLFLIAKHYFALAKRLKNKLSSQEMKQTPADLMAHFEEREPPRQDVWRVTLALGHLASCAIRLNTIDEILNSRRWTIYDMLYKKQDLAVQDIEAHFDMVVHCLMRHNAGHCEPSNRQSRVCVKKSQRCKVMERYLHSLTVEKLYHGMDTVLEAIRRDLTANYVL